MIRPAADTVALPGMRSIDVIHIIGIVGMDNAAIVRLSTEVIQGHVPFILSAPVGVVIDEQDAWLYQPPPRIRCQ